MLDELKQKFSEDIGKSKNLASLDKVYNQYLGRRGKLTEFLRSLKDLSKEKRIEQGKSANLFKKEIEEVIQKKKKTFQLSGSKTREKEWIDVTIPGDKPAEGHLHPITLVQRQTEEIFQSMGFSVVYGPEMETEYYNFDALNIPKDHPARDMVDTFWLKNGVILNTLHSLGTGSAERSKESRGKNNKSARSFVDRRGRSSQDDKDLLLRTHTSPMQARYMEKNHPPLRIIVPGRVFRHEATDIFHGFQLYQTEGLMVGEDISVANFKAIVEEFLRRFFGSGIEMRLRPSYFPFVEPGFEIDMRQRGKKWLEIMGAGMVHPNVFKAVGYNHKNWQGFAFGVGLDRLAMLKYKIDDIRLFYSGDLRFIKQF